MNNNGFWWSFLRKPICRFMWFHSDRHGPRLGESCRAQPKIRDWAHCFNGAAKGFSGLERHSWDRSVSQRIFCESDEFVEQKGTGKLKHMKWAFQFTSTGIIWCFGKARSGSCVRKPLWSPFQRRKIMSWDESKSRYEVRYLSLRFCRAAQICLAGRWRWIQARRRCR